MSDIGRALSIALLGVAGRIVEIEAHLTSQLPGFTIIGLPDTSLGEARERVRAAAVNAGSALPARRIIVNITPAALPKHGSGFDLAIGMALFAAAGIVPCIGQSVVYIGELGLDGRVRPVPGVIPMVLAAREAGVNRAVVPMGNLEEAQVVPGIDVEGVASLRQAAISAGAELPPCDADPVMPPAVAGPIPADTDLADVVGKETCVHALVVAAAGRHHMLMIGPPGAGKTMLAERLPAILPDLDAEEALELAAVRSVSGLGAASWTQRPPWEAPHHSASIVALVGGGSGTVRPGAISRATRGVLFLDEATEFPRAVLDALRQPIESGEITIHRAAGAARFPARCQVVLAANPCPCGNAGNGLAGPSCECAPGVVRRYLARMSGPLLDRVDIRLAVQRVSVAQARGIADAGGCMTSAQARAVVEEARERMAHRLRGTPWTNNAEVNGRWLRSSSPRPIHDATKDLDGALERGTLTMRGWDRVMRLAWTLADVDRADAPNRAHVRSALALRSAL